MNKKLTTSDIDTFEVMLRMEEKSKNTVEKYVRDVKKFFRYAEGYEEITKEVVIGYKQYLQENYEMTSANSMLVSLNRFLTFCGLTDCKVRTFRMQKTLCRTTERELKKEEYARLLKIAKEENRTWLYAILLTICSTGIRISELPFITVEAISCRRAQVNLKGKSRIVILPKDLCIELKRYIKEKNIHSGSIFVTRNGKLIDRSNVYHAMKKLGEKANIEQKKIFPHNLRHLFAVTFYEKERDLAHLADILGHSNVNTTRIYTMVSMQEQERKIEGLGLIL